MVFWGSIFGLPSWHSSFIRHFKQIFLTVFLNGISFSIISFISKGALVHLVRSRFAHFYHKTCLDKRFFRSLCQIFKHSVNVPPIDNAVHFLAQTFISISYCMMLQWVVHYFIIVSATYCLPVYFYCFVGLIIIFSSYLLFYYYCFRVIFHVTAINIFIIIILFVMVFYFPVSTCFTEFIFQPVCVFCKLVLKCL